MSIRAHRIIKIERAGESFNLSDDEKLMAYLEEETSFYDPLDSDRAGQTELSLDQLRDILKKKKELELSDFTIKAIAEDIESAEDKCDDYVLYDCY